MKKSKLCSRERMLCTIKREGNDHVPFSPYIGQGPWWKEPLLWNDQFQRAERMLELNMDPVIDIWLPDPQPHPDVKISTWREEKGDDIYITKEYHTPSGILRQVVRETDDWCDFSHGPWIPTTFGIEKRYHFGVELFDDWNVPRRLEPWVKEKQDLDKLRYIIRLPENHVLDEWRMDAERAKEFARKKNVLLRSRRTIVGDAFQWFCDIPWFLIQLYEDPGFVQDFLDIFHQWAISQTTLVLELGVDLVQRRGWYEGPMYWGPAMFEKYLVPSIDAECKLVHDAGALFSYLNPEGHGAYADIYSKRDIDVYEAIDPRMLHGGDLTTLYEKLSTKTAFWGGVNAEITLESKDPNVIETEVKNSIEILGQGGGLILSALLFRETTQEGILFMINAWKKYRSLYSWR